MRTMSITHPRRTWQVDHVQFPALIFFNEKTSLQLAESLESLVRDTLSREWNKFCRTQHRRQAGPWESPRNSLKKHQNMQPALRWPT